MTITIHVENQNPFCAGWLACHMGLPVDCVQLEGMAVQTFRDGYRMRAETADMEKGLTVLERLGHGDCHVAFLMEREIDVGFVRHRVTATVGP